MVVRCQNDLGVGLAGSRFVWLSRFVLIVQDIPPSPFTALDDAPYCAKGHELQTDPKRTCVCLGGDVV